MWNEMKPLFGERFPNECVVAVRGNTWQQLENVSKRGAYEFALSPVDAIEVHSNPPDLLIHSHPSPPASAAASDTDIAMQLQTKCNWGIVAVTGNIQREIYNIAYPECWGPTIPIQPLVGRSYLFGVRDCVSICWDYYQLNGAPLTRLPYVSDPGQHPDGSVQRNQFTELPRLAGLKPVNRHERLPGDLVIMQINDANRDNHCAIYMGEGRYLHQMERKLSSEWQIHGEEAVIERYNFRFWRNPQLHSTR